MYKVEAEEADYKITAEFEYLEDATRFCTKNKLELTLISDEVMEIWRKGRRISAVRAPRSPEYMLSTVQTPTKE